MSDSPGSGQLVYGGTFDPIHFGHLRTAIEALEVTSTRCCRLVPAYIPPHREMPGASAEQRLEMLQLATNGSELLRVDDREIQRGGTSYMVDTLASIRAEVGEEPLFLVLGVDAFLLIHTWHQWRQLLTHAHILVIGRPGYGLQGLEEGVAEWFSAHAMSIERAKTQPSGGICQIDLTPIGISATQIREVIFKGNSPEYLLPDAVIRYIEQYQLYSTKERS